ncbi:hydroxysteroid dehydrogenase-like protein 2 isoform X2 [Branchiostoma floridae x Branchiostoma japonicum]
MRECVGSISLQDQGEPVSADRLQAKSFPVNPNMVASALVLGASRGIGRQVALTLARAGYQVGVAAKTVQDSPKLPGTIHTVSNEITSGGGHALPISCNVRNPEEINNAVSTCIREFGGLDFAVYNAGAILWEKVIDTPLKRFDLMMDVNVRGAYVMLQAVLPHMLERKAGRILLVAPPIYSRFFKGKTPYAVTKVGMTVLVHGLARELENTGVSISALWPATTIESHVTTVKGVPPAYFRKADVFADACLAIGQEPTERLNGQALIDEDYLRSLGMTDFSRYQCEPGTEPPRIMPRHFPSLRVQEEDQVTIPDSKL